MTLSRRRFLRSLPPLAGALASPSLTRAASANGKVQHACIGVGGMMGKADFGRFLSHARTEIVAICDVDSNCLEAVRAEVPHARLYRDWREMLATEGDTIDSINATVPDHMHAAICMSAMRAGKHVYCQKPMCHDVAEVRALTREAASRNLKTQLGTQHASGAGDRTAISILQSGLIGKIRHVYVCSNRQSGMDYRLSNPSPKESTPPAHLNWDLWLGTAPARPYAEGVYHPAQWRSWLDFGTGWSGDIGCHILSAPWKALGLAAPTSITARVEPEWTRDPARQPRLWPRANHITWTFPGNDRIAGKELTMEWFDGVLPDFYIPEEIRKAHTVREFPQEASLFIGEDGSLLLPHTGMPRLFPQEKFAAFQRPKIAGTDHYHAFLDSILDDSPTESPFSIAGAMSETVLLGTIAIRLPGQSLTWDATNLNFPSSPQANALLRRPYRDGWKVDGLG